MGGWTLYGHGQSVAHFTEGANHEGFTVFQTFQNTSICAHSHHRFVGAHPCEGCWIDRHLFFAHGAFHIDGIFTISVGDDGFVRQRDFIGSVLHLRCDGGGDVAVSGGKHTFNHGAVGKESGIANHMAETFGAREFHALHIGINEHTILVVTVEFWGVHTIFWHLQTEIHIANGGNHAVVGCFAHCENTVTVGTLITIAWLVAHAEGT